MEDKFYKHLIKTAPFGYAYHKIILDENGAPVDYEFIEVNNAFEDITGLKSDKIINKKITSIIPEIERDNFNWIKFYGKVALEGGETNFEQYSIFLEKWFKVQVFSAEKYFFSTVFIDISEEKEKSAELENFFTINLDLLCIADLEGNFIKLNKAWEETLGYSIDYLEKKRFLDFVHPDDYEDTIKTISKLADGKVVINFINRYRNKENSYRYIEWRSKPRGNLIYAAARDVTDHIELEKKLERKHNDMVSFINNLPFLTWLKDSENRFVMVNEAFASSCSQPNAESLIGKNDLDIWPEDLAQDYINDDLEVMRNKMKKNVEETVNDEGDRKWFETYKAPRFDENGNVIGTVGYSRDISDRKKMEHNLALEKQRLADIIEGTNVGTWEWNVQTGETVYNERWANIIGYTLEEISPVSIDTWIKYAHSEDIKKSELLLNKHFKGEIDYYEFESRMRHKNGSWVWVLDRGRVSVWSEEGSPVLMYGTHQDITERKNIEEKLRESEERLKLIFEATGEGIWDWDITTQKVTHNKQWCYILGLDENYLEHPLDFFAEAIHPEDRENVLRKINQAVEKKVNYDSEHRMIKKDGEIIWIHDRGAIISSDENGKSIRMAGAISDITERKRIEERLKQSEENFRTFFETIDDMIFIGNQKGEIFFTNSSVSNKLGYSKEELNKMHILDVHPQDKREEAGAIFGDMFEGKRDSCPLPLARKDSSTIPAETRIWFGKWDGKNSIFGISKDLSKEQESLQMFNKIFENNPALMAISSIPDRIFINVNQVFLLKLGYEKSEIIGKKASELSIFVDDEVQKEVAFELRERGRVNNVELKVRTKSGEILDGLFSGEVIESQGKSFFLTVMTDITAQKKAEKAALAASKAKSEFLANMSHEIRTPLNGVIGFTDLLKNTSLNSVQKQYVDNANNSAHALLEVINDILDFSKIEAGKIDLEIIETDIVELVENVSDIIRFQSFSKNIELLLNISPSIPRFVEADPFRLRQILINLLSNAVKFTEKGEVELKVDFYQIDETIGKFIFSVRDTGIGINEEQQKKLFKAFSQADASTTRKFGGTGLGLVISSLLAEKMGSRIELKSSEGEGSVFYFAIETSYRFGEVLTLEDIKDIK
ncbi:MAG TPA: PAS domain S-box protein, partial [Spirochaetota bacterium]|nr:PAS domain S-box protein [Spirochaetota bacterium]